MTDYCEKWNDLKEQLKKWADNSGHEEDEIVLNFVIEKMNNIEGNNNPQSNYYETDNRIKEIVLNIEKQLGDKFGSGCVSWHPGVVYFNFMNGNVIVTLKWMDINEK